MSCDSYMKKAFNNPQKHIREAAKYIRKHFKKFDSIAVSGVSGIAFGAALAFYMKKRLVIVRAHASEHSEFSVLYSEKINRYIFVDDLIDSGRTFRRVVRGIKANEPHAKLLGAYLYEYNQIQLASDLQETYR